MLDALTRRRADAERRYEEAEEGIAAALLDGDEERARELRHARRDAAEEADDDLAEALTLAERKEQARREAERAERLRKARAEAREAAEKFREASGAVDARHGDARRRPLGARAPAARDGRRRRAPGPPDTRGGVNEMADESTRHLAALDELAKRASARPADFRKAADDLFEKVVDEIQAREGCDRDRAYALAAQDGRAQEM